ncbi:MAG: hypothetical protein AAB354_01625, partial [candidate division KSB1 bacterium]
REIGRLAEKYDGIWASACLYHLTKSEFKICLADCSEILHAGGVLYLSMKEGVGECYESKPLPGYSGGKPARDLLQGVRFYAYYAREELRSLLASFKIEKESEIDYAQGGFEFWASKPKSNF